MLSQFLDPFLLMTTVRLIKLVIHYYEGTSVPAS